MPPTIYELEKQVTAVMAHAGAHLLCGNENLARQVYAEMEWARLQAQAEREKQS